MHMWPIVVVELNCTRSIVALLHTSLCCSFLTGEWRVGNNPCPMYGCWTPKGEQAELEAQGLIDGEHQKMEAVVIGVCLKTETGLRLWVGTKPLQVPPGFCR